MVDREGFRQRLLMSEEEAESVQEQEVRANQFESQQALKFAGKHPPPFLTAKAFR